MKQVVIILTLIAVISMVVCGCIFDKPHESYAKSTIVIDVDYYITFNHSNQRFCC